MVAGPGLEGMRAVGAAHAARRPHHHRRTFVVGLVALHPRPDVGRPRLPCALEFLPIAFRIVAGEKGPIRPDTRSDEVFGGLHGNRNCPWWCRRGPARGRTTPLPRRGGRRIANSPRGPDASRDRWSARESA